MVWCFFLKFTTLIHITFLFFLDWNVQCTEVFFGVDCRARMKQQSTLVRKSFTIFCRGSLLCPLRFTLLFLMQKIKNTHKKISPHTCYFSVTFAMLSDLCVLCWATSVQGKIRLACSPLLRRHLPWIRDKVHMLCVCSSAHSECTSLLWDLLLLGMRLIIC